MREAWYQSIEIEGYGNFKEIAADYWLKVRAKEHLEFCEEVRKKIEEIRKKTIIYHNAVDVILTLPILNPEPTSNK